MMWQNKLFIGFKGILLVVLVSVFLIPSNFVRGAEVIPCGPEQIEIHGQMFSSEELIEYSPEGFLIYRFRISDGIAGGFGIKLRWTAYTDECELAGSKIFGYYEPPNLYLPSGVTYWSARFTSISHFDVWDDGRTEIIKGFDIPNFPTYTKAQFRGSAGASSSFVSRIVKIYASGEPPQFENKIEKPEPCNAMRAVGNLFDPSYERAEYVDNLLRVHLRLKPPHNIGGSFRGMIVRGDENCVLEQTSSYSQLPLRGIQFTPYMRYYSFRMISPTHWVFWDDESDAPMNCIDCEGDISPGASFVSFYGNAAGAKESWIRTTPFPPLENPCCSSILFLPGFQTSRLYQRDFFGEHQRWEPGLFSFQSDGLALLMDENGESITPTYTKTGDVIESLPYVGIDIYRTFIDQLKGFKATDTIADYKVFSYDWRMNPDDIVERGTAYEDGTHYLANEALALAASSKNGQIIIVGHSNGGLLAKALVKKLEREGLAGIVDKIVFVGTPQLGTPKAVASMLHGDFQNIPSWAGFMLSNASARELSKHMPGAYTLLPSREYFRRVAEPVIDFTSAPILRGVSGFDDDMVDEYGDFRDFLTTGTGRTVPGLLDVEAPSILSYDLFYKADNFHSDKNSWIPPKGVGLIQIAGWGLDTPKNIAYVEKTRTHCFLLEPCFTTTKLTHRVDMTSDGDGTVVAPSAVATTTWEGFYINMAELNDKESKNFKHPSITETQSFQQLFFSIIATSSLDSLPAYVSTSTPTSAGSKQLRLRVLSPVSLDAYDTEGRHTGMAPNPNPLSDLLYKEEEIPGSYYEEFGEGKYIGLPGDGDYDIRLEGLDTGTFTFEATLAENGSTTSSIVYRDVPVTASTTAEISLIENAIENTALALDTNGDGTIDTSFNDPSGVDNPKAYVALIKSTITTFDMNAGVKKQILTKLANVESMILGQGIWDARDDEPEDRAQKDPTKKILKKLTGIEKHIDKQLIRQAKHPKVGTLIKQRDAETTFDMIRRLRELI